MRRLALTVSAVVALSGPGSAAFAAQTAGTRLPDAPKPDPVALAMQYEHGEWLRQDYPRALALYCEAARHGDPRAFFNLGWMYLNGRGVARDDGAAVIWFRKAAERGVPQAANLLALLSRTPPTAVRGCPGGGATIMTMAHASPAIRALIDETAQDIGISAHLLQSVISVESGFNPNAVSPKLAAGLMQLMPETAARFGVRDRFDPRENVRGGAIYLRSLLEMFSGNLTLALAAYNAGEETVLTRGGVPPYRETIDYVAAVKRLCACGD